MPVQIGKSKLLAKYGSKLQQAHDKVKNEETVYGNIELPAGIEGGIAQLTECKFDVVKPGKENAGEYYFYAAATVKTPVEHGGIKTFGLRTSIMEMLCDTPGRTRETQAEHLSWIENQLRMLGVDTVELAVDQLEAAAAAVKEAKPYIRFRTWKGDKAKEGKYKDVEPRVNHIWAGTCEFSENGDGGGVVDNSGGEPGTEPAPGGETFDEFGDLDSLLEKAKANDATAQETLSAMALKAGHSQETVDGAVDWDGVVTLISTSPIEGEPEPPAAEPLQEEWEPKLKEVYYYKPIDPKTKKPFVDGKTKKPRKAIEVEVKTVNTKSKTVTLLNMDDKKTLYKDVSWDDLTGEQ